jgi:glucose-6-phosphate isomerase
VISNTPELTQRATWRELIAHAAEIKRLNLRQLFANDPRRAERFSAEGADLFLDYSKNLITDETLRLLLQLAHECDLRGRAEAMFTGEKINITEGRAVLHVALRTPRGASIMVDGENVVPGVHAVLDRMADFAVRIRDGRWTGHTGRRIRNIVNIGIVGSYLGPLMAYEALRD